ncbi:MAG: tetratricopeptide repeat protein [Candidatus Omnitrophica bacterium]|nr:tetratricopeptide repeat protein [Candidatus Omnitrophota bacterium]
MDQAANLYESALSDFSHQDYDSAISKLHATLEISPEFEDAHEALAVILYHQKKYDDSVQAIQHWIRLNPHSIMARTNLSRCYVAKGMILEAEKEQAEARRLTWQAELKLKKQSAPPINPQELIERYKKVIALDPLDVLGYFSLGTTYMESGMKRDAADTFEKAVEINPKHSSSYLGFAQALTALGDNEKAKRIFRQGIRVSESQGDVMVQKKMEAHLKNLESF